MGATNYFIKWLIRGFDFYIKSSIHVAFAVYALLQVSCISFEFPYNEALSYTIFYGSILGYNFIKYGSLWLKTEKPLSHKPYLILSMISGIAMCFYLMQLNVKTLICLGFGMLLSLLYSIPSYKKQNLRQLSGIKIYVVALTWLISTTIIPFVYFENPLNAKSLLYSLTIFLWVLALMIPFEIRDFPKDPNYLNTWPQQFGIENTKKTGAIIVIILMILACVLSSFEITKALFTQGFVYSLTLILILFSTTKSHRFYSSFLVESLPILWWIFLVLF